MVHFKNRWILVEFIPTGPVDNKAPSTIILDGGKSIWNALRQSVIADFGDAGWGDVELSLTVKYYSPVTNMAIIRVGRNNHRIAWGALTLMSSIENFSFMPHVIHVSGTIKHAQRSAIEHNRTVVPRFRARAKTPVGYHDSYEHYLEKSDAEIQSLQD